jgi:hypothetical protein
MWKILFRRLRPDMDVLIFDLTVPGHPAADADDSRDNRE